MNSVMAFLEYPLLLGVPVALFGPSFAVSALGRRHVPGAFAAAFGPALVCLLFMLASTTTSWGMQRVTPDAENTNAAALILVTFAFFAVGVIGLAGGGVVWIISELRRRRRPPRAV